MMQGLLISFSRKQHGTRAFTLVEVMVVVVIIGLLAAMSLPTYRHITLRSKATALVNDLRAYSTALVTYNLQNGHWPADSAAQQIPPEVADAIPHAFAQRTPIGGVYKWNYNVSADGITAKAAIIIETSGSEVMTDDVDLLEMIDKDMDDGNLATGTVMLGATNTLVYIIEI